MLKNINLDILSYFYDRLKHLFENKVDKETGKGLSTNDYTTAEKNKLSGISEGANKIVVDSTLSDTSTNPIQNKVVKTALDSKVNSDDVYTKTESDNRFLNVDGTAKKAVADENGMNIAESFANLLGLFVDVNLSELTFDTGVSLVADASNRLRYKKMGNMVFVDCKLRLNVGSTYANITTSITSSIPTEYNPSKIQTLVGRCMHYVSDSNSNSGIVMCQIGLNKLTLYLPDNKPLKNISNINFNISGMYALD